MDKLINVLILIPTLDIGGVEVDLVRTLPLVARERFNISVLTFLRRGILADGNPRPKGLASSA